ncbi:Cuticle protein 14 isoform a, partial [Stegodyphus mimosarum]
MKLLIFLSIVISSQAAPLLVRTHALPEVGSSTQYKTQDSLGNYAFGYNEDHTSGGSFRKEFGDSLGNKIGYYGLHNVADDAGFRADVHTNEPGVDPTQDSADVTVNKPVVVAPLPTTIAHPVTIAKHHTAVLVHNPIFHAIPVESLYTHGHLLLQFVDTSMR